MPAVLVAAGVGAVGGFVLGKGADGAANVLKWGAAAGVVYIAAKHFKVI